MAFLDENGLEQVLNGIKDNTLPFTEDLVFDEDKKLTEIVMGNVKTSMDVNGWIWTETDDYTSVDENTYANDTSNADYIYEYVPKQIVYSANEVNTGNVWIDGKPIYRYVYDVDNFNTGTGTGNMYIHQLPSDVENIITINGCSKTDTGVGYPLSYYNSDTNAQSIYVFDSTHESYPNYIVFRHTYTTARTYKLIVIVEYTKPTDIV